MRTVTTFRRTDFARATDWWERELRRLGVDVRTGVKASAADVSALDPDAVIVATGAEVTIVSSNYAPFSNRLLFAFDGIGVARRLAEAGVSFVGATWVREIGESTVDLYEVNGGRTSRMADIDAVVLATGRISNDGLAADLEGKVAQLFVIGNALGVRPWATATYEGHKFARMIGEPGAPGTSGEAFFRRDDPKVFPAPAHP